MIWRNLENLNNNGCHDDDYCLLLLEVGSVPPNTSSFKLVETASERFKVYTWVLIICRLKGEAGKAKVLGLTW